MKNFFLQFTKPKTSYSENEIQYWREKIVAVTLIGAAILGIIPFGYGLLVSIQNQAWSWAVILTVFYSIVFLIAFSPQVPYLLRAWTILGILLVFGLISAIQFGAVGNGGIWLLSFSILAVVYLGMRAGILATIFNIAALLLLGFLIASEWINPPILTEIVDPKIFSSWVITTVMLVVIAIISILPLGFFFRDINRNLDMRRQITDELRRDRSRLERRSLQLQRRESQVRTAAEISRIISAELNPQRLFPQVVNLIKEGFNLYYVGVFLTDDRGQFALLHAGTGDPGKRMVEDGHRLPIDDTSMIGWAISHRQARIALDVGRESVRFENPYLPDTRSEIALPMISGIQVLGAITIQSEQPEAFTQDDIVALQGVADAMASAIENARLFQQTEKSLQEIRGLHQRYLGQTWTDASVRGENLSCSFENPELTTVTGAPLSTFERSIHLRDQVIGKVSLETEKSALDPEEEAFIQAVLNQSAIALENVRLMEATQKSAQHDRIVTDLSAKVWATADMDTILRTTLLELVKSLDASKGLIQLSIPQELPISGLGLQSDTAG